jgi:hypothetical protein
MSERTLDQQFSALPDDIKGRLFRVLDVLVGASQAEKDAIGYVLGAMAKQPAPPGAEPMPELMRALANLTMWTRIAADPKDGE